MTMEPHALNIGRSALLTDLALCINHYRLSTPGLYVCVHAPLHLDGQPQITPGVLAMVNYGVHKQCHTGDAYQAFHGPPNFIADVFAPGDHASYESRREQFEQAGVGEYLAVFDEGEPRWCWNHLDDGTFSELPTDDDGVIRSRALPGLWVPGEALSRRDWWAITAATSHGVTRRPHHDFMATIWNAE